VATGEAPDVGDLVFLGLALAFFALSWGLVMLAEGLK
jgi:hypothetical protein